LLTDFPGLQMFFRVQEVSLKNVVRCILILNKISNLNFALEHSEDKGSIRNFKFRVLSPAIQIPTKNGKIKVLFNKIHRRINLMEFLFSNSRSSTPLELK
jgi:hypothetical protein